MPDPNTRGVTRPGTADVREDAAYPAATVADFKEYGDRAGEIALAAKTRPGAEALFAPDLTYAQQKEIAAQIFNADGQTVFGNKGYTVKVQDATVRGDSASIVFSVLGENGRPIRGAYLVRGLSRNPDGTFHIYNAHMEFPSSAQGTGFAQAWNRNMENWLIANGSKEMRVSAGLSKGGAVWALQGFDWSSTDTTSAVGVASRMLSSISQNARTPAERAQVADLERRLLAAQQSDDRSLVPTPLELALVGWRPGAPADSWAGYKGMAGKGWGGVKRLDPNHHTWKQNLGHERARAANQRVKDRVNVADVSPEFAQRFSNQQVQIPGLSEGDIAEIGATLAGRQSLAGLTPAAKKGLSNWVRGRMSGINVVRNMDPQEFKDHYNLLRAIRDEENAEAPKTNSALADDLVNRLNLRVTRGPLFAGEDVQYDNLPDWDIEPISARGVNVTLKATHKASGQVFIIKNDVYGPRASEDTGQGANSEADVNQLLRLMGWQGLGEAVVNPNQGQRDQVVQQRVGDNLDLIGLRAVNAGSLGEAGFGSAIQELANPDEALRMYLLDVALGNNDRHPGNFMIGRDSDGFAHLFPIDHGLAGSGNGWTMVDNATIYDRMRSAGYASVYQYMKDALQKYGKENTQTMLQAAIKDYREALTLDGVSWHDPDFKAKMEQSLAEMERNMARILRRWFP
jgi:hypothetical protein